MSVSRNSIQNWSKTAILAVSAGGSIGVGLPIIAFLGNLNVALVALGVIGAIVALVSFLIAPPVMVLGGLLVARGVVEGTVYLRGMLPPVIISQSTAALSAFATSWALVFLTSRRINVSRIPLFWPITFFLSALLLPVIWSTSSNGVFEWVRLLNIYLIYSVVYVLCRQHERVRSFVPNLLLLSTVLPVTIGYFLYIHGQVQPRFETGIWVDRMISTFSSSNRFSTYLTQGLTICIGLCLTTRSTTKRFLYLGYAVLLAVTIVLTYTRTAWVMIAVGVAILGYFYNKRLWFVFMLVAVLVLQFPLLTSRWSLAALDLTSANAATSTLAGRLAAWRVAWQWFLESPLLGYGLGYFRGGSVQLIGWWSIPHNVYLQVLTEGGILGFLPFIVLWLSFIVVTLRRLYLNRRNPWIQVLLALLVQIMLAMLTENMFTDTANMSMFWAFAGFALASVPSHGANKENK